MKLKFNSLNIKTTIIYVVLALLNISIITGLIFENQSDLIVKNTILEAEKIVYTVNSEIQNISMGKIKNRKGYVKSLESILRSIKLERYAIFDEQADILSIFPEKDRSNISEKIEFTNVNRAIFKKENEGKVFHAEISDTPEKLKKQKVINFYMPLTSKGQNNITIKLTVSIMGIDEQMGLLYRQLGLLIAGMVIIVIVIALLYNRMVIRPVKLISKASKDVADGDYKVKVSVKNKDEIGTLSYSFNDMVRSLDTTTNQLKETIGELEEQNDLIQHELDIARSIQEGMLPATVDYDRVKVATYYKALEKISGDYYDIVEFPDGSLGIIIADVSGHGIPAALITIMAKFLFYTYGAEYQSPAELMERMNREIAKTVKTGDYITAFYMIIDPGNGVRYANAGHHNTLVHKKKTGEIEELEEEGIYLGLIEELPTPYGVSKGRLEKGDRIILYTDGISEQANPEGEQYGDDRLKEQIKAHYELPIDKIVSDIIEDVNQFSGGSKRIDDYTLFAIEITADAKEIDAPEIAVIPEADAPDVPESVVMPEVVDPGTSTVIEVKEDKGETRETETQAPIGKLFIKITKKGKEVIHIDIPANFVSESMIGHNDGENDFIRIEQDSIFNVTVDDGYTLTLSDNSSIRIVEKKGRIIYADIPKEILSDNYNRKFKGEYNFLRLKNKGLRIKDL